jgi:ATP-binding cassette subfamily B protein
MGQVLIDGGQQSCQGLWLVCAGRVRLLGIDRQHDRDISVGVLGEGDVIDAATVLEHLPYRAIAASDGVVAYLPPQPTVSLLQTQASLRQRLQAQGQQWEQVLFFKTRSDLGRGKGKLTSEQFQQLLPDLELIEIPAGQHLAQSPASSKGYCWLRDGQVSGSTQPLPDIGDSWGAPQTVPPDWIAQTPLRAYCLPQESWSIAAAIAPRLAEKLAIAPAETPVRRRRANATPIPVIPLARDAALPANDASAGSNRNPSKNSNNNVVEFPRPNRRRYWHPRLLRSKPFIEQQSSSDCGIACLAMISQYWGKRYPLPTLREMAQVGRSGTTLRNLATTAEKLGFHTRPVRASLDRMAEQRNPWIAHWQGDHYIVVYQVKPQRVLVADPACGKRWLKKKEFVAGWTGYALMLEPTQQLKEIDTKTARTLGTFGRIVLTYKGLLGQIVLVSLLLQVFGLFSPLLTQVILDQVLTQKSVSALYLFTIGSALFSIWRLGLGSVRQYLLDYLSNRLDLTLVSSFISHTLRLPMKFFEDRNVGDIITRIQENSKIQNFLIRQLVSTWLDASMAVVYLGLMLYYNWKLSLLVLGIIPPMILLTLGATPFLKRLSREMFKEEADQTSQIVEMMSGISTIKATATEQEVRWRWEDRFVDLLNVRFRGQKLANGLGITSGVINSLGSALLLWYGAMLVIQDQLTVGQYVAFNMLIGNVTGPILSVIGVWDELQEVLIAVERLNDVFSTKPEEVPGQPMLVLPAIHGEIQFEQVTFSYDGSKDFPTLQNLSFVARPGQTIAIVGRSGSGKTTLVKLLQGMYYPTQGRILVDGHDIRHVSPHSLRSQIGVVPQDSFLFSGTILENIRMYRSEFSLEQVIEVAKLAEANPFIQDLPLGYNTKIGERGTNLSGGQRQRVSIARALLGNPPLLILDEATSSLDTESERRFQHNLERISRDRTTFIIAHRLSTVQNADRILVIDRGILAEEGTHDELLQTQGIYYHLAQQQLNL